MSEENIICAACAVLTIAILAVYLIVIFTRPLSIPAFCSLTVGGMLLTCFVGYIAIKVLEARRQRRF